METFVNSSCDASVSILYALVFGADGACVKIGIVSILSAFAAFMVLVVIAQFIARRLWAHLTTPPMPPEPENKDKIADDPAYQDSPIRSGRR